MVGPCPPGGGRRASPLVGGVVPPIRGSVLADTIGWRAWGVVRQSVGGVVNIIEEKVEFGLATVDDICIIKASKETIRA